MRDSYQVYIAKREMGKPTKAYFQKEDAIKDICENGGKLEEMEVFEEYQIDNEEIIVVSAHSYRTPDLSETTLWVDIKRTHKNEYVKADREIEYEIFEDNSETIRLNFELEHIDDINTYDISVIRGKVISDLGNIFKKVDEYKKHGCNCEDINFLLNDTLKNLIRIERFK